MAKSPAAGTKGRSTRKGTFNRFQRITVKSAIGKVRLCFFKYLVCFSIAVGVLSVKRFSCERFFLVKSFGAASERPFFFGGGGGAGEAVYRVWRPFHSFASIECGRLALWNEKSIAKCLKKLHLSVSWLGTPAVAQCSL